MGAALLLADGQTNERADSLTDSRLTKLIVAFPNLTKLL